MRVLRVASDIYPWVVGGYPIHVHEMAYYQEKMGVHNTVVAVKPRKGNKVDENVEINYDLKLFNESFEVLGNKIELIELYDKISNLIIKKYNE